MTQKKNIQIVNRKAKYEYTFIQSFEAGMMLKGTEVKSLRQGNGNIADAFCKFEGTELFIFNLYIAEYEYGNQFNHETRRKRKLLLKRTELKKLQKRVEAKGLTIAPYKIFFSERGFAKIEIALAQGKKSYDKRNSLKEKDLKRELDRMNEFK